jgi:TRAP-type C4-dicarboxylate transport system permease small subunit
MLQIIFEGTYLWYAIIFILIGLGTFGWLVIHIEGGRHQSNLKVAFAIILGALFLGMGLHFYLLASGI